MSIVNLFKAGSKMTVLENGTPKIITLTKNLVKEYSKKFDSKGKDILNIQDSNGKIFTNTTPGIGFKLSDKDTNYLNNLNKNADDFIQKPNGSTTKNTTGKKTTTNATGANKNTDSKTTQKIAEASDKVKEILKRNPRLAKAVGWTGKTMSKGTLPLTIVTGLYQGISNINPDLYDISEDKTALQNTMSNLHVAIPEVVLKGAIGALGETADLGNMVVAKTIGNAVDGFHNLFGNKESASVEHDELIYKFLDKGIDNAKSSAKAAFDWFTSIGKVNYKDAKKNYLAKEGRDEEGNLIPDEEELNPDGIHQYTRFEKFHPMDRIELKSPEQMADDMRNMKDVVGGPSGVTQKFEPIQFGGEQGRTIRQTPEGKYVFKSAVDGKDRSFDTIDAAKKAISEGVIGHKKKELQDKLPNIKTEEELSNQMTSTKQALLDRGFSEGEIKNILGY